jgi:hypothetical protein
LDLCLQLYLSRNSYYSVIVGMGIKVAGRWISPVWVRIWIFAYSIHLETVTTSSIVSVWIKMGRKWFPPAWLRICGSVPPCPVFNDWLWWGETMSQNCSHQRAYSSPGWYVSMASHGDDGAGWVLVHQSSLAVLPAETSGASRMGPPALLLVRRKVCCGFLSPLQIHLGWVWTRDPWVQWQAH